MLTGVLAGNSVFFFSQAISNSPKIACYRARCVLFSILMSGESPRKSGVHELTEEESFQRLLKNCSNELYDELTSTRHHTSAEKPGNDLIVIFNL